jgi:hypothetical protein
MQLLAIRQPKKEVGRKHFHECRQLIVKVNEILMDIPLHEFISVFDEWKRRLVE